MRFSLLAVFLSSFASLVSGQSVVTSFSRADGFASRDFSNVVFSDGDFTATFIGGVQEQSFDGPAYNAGPDAYFFVNGTYTGTFGVRPLTGNTDVGSVQFNTGVQTLSFSAADRANGTPSLRVLGTDGSVLATETIASTSNRSATALFSFDADDLGGLIGGVEFDNAGPAANPPYVIALDSFSATAAPVAVPEPSSLAALAMAATAVAARRRRRRAEKV